MLNRWGVVESYGELGGSGYIAGELSGDPEMADGLLTVNGVPSSREIEVRERRTRRVVAVRRSRADGTYRFAGLNPQLSYDLIARDYLREYEDVIVGGIMPAWPDNEVPAPLYAQAPAPVDPYWKDISSQLCFRESSGSVQFADDAGKQWSVFGNAKIDQLYGPALLLDGAGDYATTPAHGDFNFGAGLFTVDGFFRESVRGPIRQIIGQHSTQGGDETNCNFLVLSDNGKLVFQVFMGATYYTIANPATHPLDTNLHYAAVRDVGNVFRLFVGGVQVASLTQAGALNNSLRPVTIGAVMNGSAPNPGGYYFNGRIMPQRISKGVARYSANFTPPPMPFAGL